MKNNMKNTVIIKEHPIVVENFKKVYDDLFKCKQ